MSVKVYYGDQLLADSNATEDIELLTKNRSMAHNIMVRNSSKLGDIERISLELLPESYELSLNFFDAKDNVLFSTSVDLPLEMAFVGARVNEAGDAIVFTLQNGTEVSLSVGEMISALNSKLDKNTDASDIPQVYAKDKYGNQIMMDTGEVDGGLAKYYGNAHYPLDNIKDLHLYTADVPVLSEDVVSSIHGYKALNYRSADAMYLKIPEPYPSNSAVPAIHSNGKISKYKVSASNLNNTIAVYYTASTGKYDSGGCLNTSKPEYDYNCANKKYVDEQIAQMADSLRNEFLYGINKAATVSTVAAMDNILMQADETEVNKIYLYKGENTDDYENGTLYILEEV